MLEQRLVCGAGIRRRHWLPMVLANLPITGATNATLNLGPVSVSQSGGNFKVVVSNSLNSVTSQVAVLTVVDTLPPVVTLNGNAIVSLLQGGTFTDQGNCDRRLCRKPAGNHQRGRERKRGRYLSAFVYRNRPKREFSQQRPCGLRSGNQRGAIDYVAALHPSGAMHFPGCIQRHCFRRDAAALPMV